MHYSIFLYDTQYHHDDSVVCLGIAWTLYNLAIHPEHQEKCRQEVDAIFSEKDENDNDITRYNNSNVIMFADFVPCM